jgi:hypothetical protein
MSLLRTTPYRPGGYHPVHLGDVFNNRYRVLLKPSAGSFSTVWLALDEEYHSPFSDINIFNRFLRLKRYVALKIVVASKSKDSQEFKILPTLDNQILAEPKPKEAEDLFSRSSQDNHVLVRRRDGKVDKRAPRHLVKPIQLQTQDSISPGFQVKIVDFGSGQLNSKPSQGSKLTWTCFLSIFGVSTTIGSQDSLGPSLTRDTAWFTFRKGHRYLELRMSGEHF